MPADGSNRELGVVAGGRGGAERNRAPQAHGCTLRHEAARAALPLVDNCLLLGLDPQLYLEDVLLKIQAGWPLARLSELTPARWALEHPRRTLSSVLHVGPRPEDWIDCARSEIRGMEPLVPTTQTRVKSMGVPSPSSYAPHCQRASPNRSSPVLLEVERVTAKPA